MNADYETETDKENELRCMNAIAERYNVEVVMCPPQYQFDAMIIKEGKIDAMIEYKRRHFASGAYPTSFVGLNKTLFAHNFRQATGIPCNLVVEWDDMIGMINFKLFSKVTVGGRTDRNDPNDRMLLAHYPVEHFKVLDLF